MSAARRAKALEPAAPPAPAPAGLAVPPECVPQPLPNVLMIEPDLDRQQVRMRIFDATGQRIVYLTPDAADQLAPVLLEAARVARSGLLVTSAMPGDTPPRG